jgi:hypothetical protein
VRVCVEIIIDAHNKNCRIHDNPALLEAIRQQRANESVTFYPVFIFDGQSAGN